MSQKKFIHAVTITRAGQITIPKEARRMLDLREGDKLLVYVSGDKIFLMKPE